MSSQESNSFEDLNFETLEPWDVQKKVELLENALSQLLPRFTQDNIALITDFSTRLFPSIKQFYDSLLQTSLSLVTENEGIKNENDINLKETILACIDILSCLNSIFFKLMESDGNKLEIIANVILTTMKIILSTFQHCLNSNKNLKTTEDISENLTLFKKSQENHSLLLKLLENHIVVNYDLPGDIRTLCETFDLLGQMGEILSGVNIKSFADNWKCYTNLLLRHGNIIFEVKNCQDSKLLDLNLPDKSLSDLNKSILFLSAEVLRILKQILEGDLSDLRSITIHLKVANFLIKVIQKLSETFSKYFANILITLWNFFIDIKEYSPIYLYSKNIPEQIVNLIDSNVLQVVDKFCSDTIALKEVNFLKAYVGRENLSQKNEAIFLLALGSILDSIYALGSDFVLTNELDENILILVGDIFTSVELQNKRQIDPEETFAVADVMAQKIATIAFVLTQSGYSLLEELLLNNILNSNNILSIFASDIYVLILKESPELAYDTFLNLIEIFLESLTQHVCLSLEYVRLQFLLKRIYVNLNSTQKLSLHEQYGFNSFNAKHFHVWKFFTLDSSYKLEQYVNKLVDLQEDFNSERLIADDFLQMCLLLEIIGASLKTNRSINSANFNVTLNKITRVLSNLWCWVELSADNSNVLLKILLKGLFKVTPYIFNKLDLRTQQIIANKMKMISSEVGNYFVKLLLIDALKNIYFFNNAKFENQINSIFNQIWRTLLQDSNRIIEICDQQKNSIIQQRTVDVYIKLKNLPLASFDISKLVAEFERKFTPGQNLDFVVNYLEGLNNIDFKHKCVEWSNSFEPLFKKIKFDNFETDKANIEPVKQYNKLQQEHKQLNVVLKENIKTSNEEANCSDASEAIGEIKKYTQDLCKIPREKLTKRNLYDLRCVLNKLHTLL